MRIAGIFILKIANTLRYRHNLILMLALPALAAVGAWALAAFYFEGGANIPVGVLDYDKTEFSETAIARFSANSTVGVRVYDTGDVSLVGITETVEPEAAADADAAALPATNADTEAETAALPAVNADTEAEAEAEAADNVIAQLIIGSGEYQAAVIKVQNGSIEAVVVILPGFSQKLLDGEPEGIFDIISNPSGVSRGLVAELFAAQVSRIYFGCDSANRVVRDAITAARAARKPPLTDDEKQAVFDEAFAYCNAYWEPQPLMTVDYERYIVRAGASALSNAQRASPSSYPATATLPGSSDGWGDMREMLNSLISRAIFAIFFTYAVFCVLNVTGVMISEREDGILTRMKAHGFGAGTWITVSAAAPFVLYGIPCAALLSLILNNPSGAVFAFAALACASTAGSAAAYMIKAHGGYRAFTLVCVILSMGLSLYWL